MSVYLARISLIERTNARLQESYTFAVSVSHKNSHRHIFLDSRTARDYFEIDFKS